MIDTSSLFLCRYSPSFDQQEQIIATTIASVVQVVVNNVHTHTYHIYCKSKYCLIHGGL